MPAKLCIFTIYLPPSNQSSCSDVPSESHPTLLYVTSIHHHYFNHHTSPDVATPQTISISQYVILLNTCLILYVSQSLRPSVTQFLPHSVCISALSTMFSIWQMHRDSWRSKTCGKPTTYNGCYPVRITLRVDMPSPHFHFKLGGDEILKVTTTINQLKIHWKWYQIVDKTILV